MGTLIDAVAAARQDQVAATAKMNVAVRNLQSRIEELARERDEARARYSASHLARATSTILCIGLLVEEGVVNPSPTNVPWVRVSKLKKVLRKRKDWRSK